MKLVWAALIIVGAAGAAVAAMLLVRRNAPDGGYFNDGDRASGVFGVLATGFSVLLGSPPWPTSTSPWAGARCSG